MAIILRLIKVRELAFFRNQMDIGFGEAHQDRGR